MRRPPLAFVLSTAAVVLSAGLIADALWLPSYSVEGSETVCTSSGPCTSTSSTGSATLVEVNGNGVLKFLLIPVALSVIAWIGLWFRCAGGSRAGLVVGWAAAFLMLALAFLAGSIGLLVVPLAVMMMVAAGHTPDPAERHAP